MRTHVGRYVLPKKLAAAQKAARASVAVPIPEMLRLLARVGEPVLAAVPEPGPEPEGLPASVASIPEDLVGLIRLGAGR